MIHKPNLFIVVTVKFNTDAWRLNAAWVGCGQENTQPSCPLLLGCIGLGGSQVYMGHRKGLGALL